MTVRIFHRNEYDMLIDERVVAESRNEKFEDKIKRQLIAMIQANVVEPGDKFTIE